MHTTPKLALAGVAMLGVAVLIATRNGQTDSGSQVDQAIGETEVSEVPAEARRSSKSDRPAKPGRSAARVGDGLGPQSATADADRSDGNGETISSEGGRHLPATASTRARRGDRSGSATAESPRALNDEPLARESWKDPNEEGPATEREIAGRAQLAPGDGMAYPAYSGTAGSWRALDMDHLQVRDGVTFRIDTDEPFSGRVVQALDDGAREERHYQDGLPHGSFSSYNAEGRLQTREFFAHGKRDGVLTTYYPDGQRHFEAEIEDGRQVGATTWDPKGEVRTKWRHNDQGRRINLLNPNRFANGGINVRPGAD